MTVNCPHCRSRTVGKVAVQQYYCWDCCIEFTQTGESLRCFQVNEEGELLSFEPQAAQQTPH